VLVEAARDDELDGEAVGERVAEVRALEQVDGREEQRLAHGAQTF